MNRAIFLNKFFIQLIAVIIFICGAFPLFAQKNFSISGTVKTVSDKKALPGANIVLRKIKDHSFVTGTTTNSKGYYIISNINPEKYILEISYIGYKTDSFSVTVKDADIKQNPIFLEEESIELKGVNVQATQKRVEIKGDTIQFNADAYKTQPDASALDLVKKMPGITLEGNTITANGEQVKKVLIDGKPFFSDDPSATLKNFPAYSVDYVQVFSQSSDQAMFTGFRDDNDEKTINLTTKHGQNFGQFGNIYAGYGTDNRYNAGITLNSFNGSQRISLIGMTNNINQQNFNISDIMNVMNNAGTQRGGGPPGRGSDASNFFTGQQNGNTNTNACGINYVDVLGKKIKISGNYFFNNTDNTTKSDLTRSFFTQNPLQYDETNSSQIKNSNHKVYLKFEYVIDSLNKLTITPRFTKQTNNSISNLSGVNYLPQSNEFISKTENNSSSENNGFNFSTEILMQHKFHKKGRTISLDLIPQENRKDGSGEYYSSSWYVDTLTDSKIQDQYNNSNLHTKALSGNLSYTEPIGKRGQMLISYRQTFTENSTDKTTLSLDSAGFYSIPEIYLSNKYKNTYQTKTGGIAYRANVGKSSFSFGTDLQQADLKAEQQNPEFNKTSKNFTDILPNASYNYKFSKMFNLDLIYRTVTKSPSYSQLQNTPDVSNPLFVKTGNPDLRQTYENNLTLRMGKRPSEKEKLFLYFSNGKPDKPLYQQCNICTEFRYNHRKYTDKPWESIDCTGEFKQLLLCRCFGVYGFPLVFIKSNLNLNAGYTITHSPALINEIINYSYNHAMNGGFYLSSNISEAFDFSVSYSGSYNTVINDMESQTDNNYFNHNASLKVNWILFKQLVLSSDITQTSYFGLSESYDQNYMIWNGSIGYKFLKDKSLEAKISLYDILDQNSSINQTVTETYIEESNTQVLDRYLMLTLTYTFKHFKSGSVGPDQFDFPKNMPPPPKDMKPPGGDI